MRDTFEPQIVFEVHSADQSGRNDHCGRAAAVCKQNLEDRHVERCVCKERDAGGTIDVQTPCVRTQQRHNASVRDRDTLRSPGRTRGVDHVGGVVERQIGDR